MSDSDMANKIQQYGLTEVYSAQSPLVDIVFVHGLNGHPYNTWSTKQPDVYWPTDLLPKRLEEEEVQVRILAYGYDASVHAFTDGVSKDTIHHHAESLAAALVARRGKRALERPIIFVCHSLGGLVVKRCLIYSESIRSPKLERTRSIFVSTYGILFLGTPHNGSDIAKWGSLLQSICSAVLPKKFFDSSPQLVNALKTHNETLQNINRLFAEIIGRYSIYFFHESRPTDVRGTRQFIVDEHSAAPDIGGVERSGIPKDHIQMCKFESENSPGFEVVADAIQRYSEEAIGVIPSRWSEEKRIRELERRGQAQEMLGGSLTSDKPETLAETNPAPRSGNTSLGGSGILGIIDIEPEPRRIDTDSILVAPPGFRPNANCFGFQRELKRLDMALHDQFRTPVGTCAVLVWGPPGCGKTHLARQYLWTHRSSYPAGVFWIDARSEESRLKSYWDIVQAVSLIEAAGLTDEPTFGQAEFVETVRHWLESKKGWLMVFDGVSFDTEKHLQRMTKFLPDHPGNNIIFTSVDRNLAKRVRLFSPEAIEVEPLGEDEACMLLYDRLDISHPTPKQVAKAKELVTHFQCLPLAIHATAHRLRARGQFLEKFNVTSSTTDQRLAEPFNGIIQDLMELQHQEAINLINILAFFDHFIPVGMIHLGRRALVDFQIEVRSLDRPGSLSRNLDETIATLIRHGLCERSLQRFPYTKRSQAQSNGAKFTKEESLAVIKMPSREDSSFESSSTASSSYTVDVLKVHNVAQGFCRDDLRDRGKLEYWWLVAVKLFCYAYHTVEVKMKEAAGDVLTRDYREFDTHAARLRQHYPHKAKHKRRDIRITRNELDEVIRKIQAEVNHGSPIQSFKSDREVQQLSVFDRTGSSSSDDPTTPSSTPSRTLTWGQMVTQVEHSPTKIHNVPHNVTALPGLVVPPRFRPEDAGYGSDLDVPGSNFESSTVSPVTSEEMESSTHLDSARPRPTTMQSPDSILRQIFEGRHHQSRAKKDLGQWHPLPTQPSVTHTAATAESPQRTRAFSFGQSSTSSSSEAKAALASIHRASPPAARGGAARSLSRPRHSNEVPSPVGQQDIMHRETSGSISELPRERRMDLNRGRSAAYSTSPLANQYLFEPSTARPQARSAPTYPLESASRSQPSDLGIVGIPPLPIEENITITPARRTGAFQGQHRSTSAGPREATENSLDDSTGVIALRSGFSSTPMSRDVSQESQASQTSEPSRHKPAFVTSPELRESITDMQRNVQQQLLTDITNNNSNRRSDPAVFLPQLQSSKRAKAPAQTKPPYPIGDAEIMPSSELPPLPASRRSSLANVFPIEGDELALTGAPPMDEQHRGPSAARTPLQQQETVLL